MGQNIDRNLYNDYNNVGCINSYSNDKSIYPGCPGQQVLASSESLFISSPVPLHTSHVSDANTAPNNVLSTGI